MDDKVKATFYISKPIKEKLRIAAYGTGKAQGVIIDEVLEAFFDKFEKTVKRRSLLLFGN